MVDSDRKWKAVSAFYGAVVGLPCIGREDTQCSKGDGSSKLDDVYYVVFHGGAKDGGPWWVRSSVLLRSRDPTEKRRGETSSGGVESHCFRVISIETGMYFV